MGAYSYPEIFSNSDFSFGLLLFSVVMAILLLVSIFSGSGTSRVDLMELYDMFEGMNAIENHMNFDIDMEGCHIRGEYKGDHFREVIASGEHELCERFNVTLGTDPDEFTDKLVKRDIIDKINRLQNKKKCTEMIGETACGKIPKCKWIGSKEDGECLNRKDIKLSHDCTKIRAEDECIEQKHCNWSDKKCSNII